MAEELDASINTRVPRRVRHTLEQVAKDRRVSPLTFARTILDEGLRRERHPGSDSAKEQLVAGRA